MLSPIVGFQLERSSAHAFRIWRVCCCLDRLDLYYKFPCLQRWPWVKEVFMNSRVIFISSERDSIILD